MGSRGPVPKRSAERRRRNKTPDVDTLIVSHRIRQPAARADWHPVAKQWFNRIKRSAVAKAYFDESDYGELVALAEILSDGITRKSPGLLATWQAGSSRLMTTEADRRRMRLEIEHGTPEADDADVTEMDEYRRARQG